MRTRPWRPPEFTSPLAKSFVLRQTICKRLIFLKWHGRGREFESLQVHQNKAQQNTDLRNACALPRRGRGQAESIWSLKRRNLDSSLPALDVMGRPLEPTRRGTIGCSTMRMREKRSEALPAMLLLSEKRNEVENLRRDQDGLPCEEITTVVQSRNLSDLSAILDHPGDRTLTVDLTSLCRTFFRATSQM